MIERNKGIEQRISKDRQKSHFSSNGAEGAILSASSLSEESRQLERSKRALEEKAKLYERMKAGELLDTGTSPIPLASLQASLLPGNERLNISVIHILFPDLQTCPFLQIFPQNNVTFF